MKHHDETKRYITKISRVVQMYTNKVLKDYDLTSSEFLALRYIRKKRGVNQDMLCDVLNVDKSAVTRILKKLETKGYITREIDENDRRHKKISITERTKKLKMASISYEELFYTWLLEDIDEEKKKVFLEVLDEIYVKSKAERKAKFENILKLGGVNDD